MRPLGVVSLLSLATPISAQASTDTEPAASTSTSLPAQTTSSDGDVASMTTVVEALTTTFTPPASCTQGSLTQLASPGYQIWLNEPQPVPGSVMSDCYPSEFMNGYTSLEGSSSSIAPLMSPLVCPMGWNTARFWDNGYIACCASGYHLALPTEPVDTNRPAYGGTCYSNFEVGTTVTVTAYDSNEATAVAEWVATSSADQAYAHPIDGFSLLLPDERRMSSGTVAGVVIGSLLAFSTVGVAAFFLIFRRAPPEHPVVRKANLDKLENEYRRIQSMNSSMRQAYLHKSLPPKPSPTLSTPAPSEADAQPAFGFIRRTGTLAAPASSSSHQGRKQDEPTPPKEAHELRGQLYVELDSGWQGHELPG